MTLHEYVFFGEQFSGPGHYDPLYEETFLLLELRGYFTEFHKMSCFAPLGLL